MAVAEETRVLLVEPDPELAASIVSALEGAGMHADSLESFEKAFNYLESERIHAVVTRPQIGGTEAFRLVDFAREHNPESAVVILSPVEDQDLALEAMRQGADDFQLLPPNTEKLQLTIAHARKRQQLAEERFRLHRRLDERYGLGALVGQSRHIAQAYEQVRELAASSVPVIITGDPGTGKDLVAQIIHRQSARAGTPFVRLNASEVEAPLLDRLCFGHVANAFPGATEATAGMIEHADGGSFYMESVRKLVPRFVDTLLESIATRRIRRIGDTRDIPIDIRLFVSVEPDLSNQDAASTFLSRLTNEFQAATIALPPLRQREGDVPLLATHFLEVFAAAMRRPAPGFTGRAMDLLSNYKWPGNVRELKDLVEEIMQRVPNRNTFDINDLPAQVRDAAAPEAGSIPIPPGTSMRDAERMIILETWRANGYNKEKTAETLGIGLRTVYRKLKQYGET